MGFSSKLDLSDSSMIRGCDPIDLMASLVCADKSPLAGHSIDKMVTSRDEIFCGRRFHLEQDAIFFVTDIETDGPDPGIHSMVSLASVACSSDGTHLGHLALNIQPVDGHESDAGTMAWWATEPAAWAATLQNRLPPHSAMVQFVDWVRSYGRDAVFVSYPLTFDGIWVDWYLRRFANFRLLRAPRSEDRLFSGGGLDLASFAMGRTGLSYNACTKKHYPEIWFGGHLHSHVALDDAKGYASLFRRFLSMPPK